MNKVLTMTSPVPSRKALRALSRLCRSDPLPLRQYTSSARQSHRLPTLHSSQTRQPTLSPSQMTPVRFKSTIIDAPETSHFANDPSRYNPQNRGVEPKKRGTSDPQLDSQAALPDITNYYTLFPRTIPHGPPQAPSRVPDSNTELSGEQPTSSFYINPRDLRKEFLRLQSVYHPDKFPAGSTAHQRAYALSTLLNNAYKTLSDPLLRAQYVLQLLYDIDVTNEDNSAHPTDPETLMLVMEAQEELENAEGEDGKQVVERLKEENRVRIRETERELGEAFEAGDAEGARDWSVKLKYWKSLESGLDEWEPGKEVRLTH